jgi:hypothetical protein
LEKNLVNIIAYFWAAKIKSFQNTNLSDIDSQNNMKGSNGVSITIRCLYFNSFTKAGLSDDEEESKALYNVLIKVQDLNQIIVCKILVKLGTYLRYCLHLLVCMMIYMVYEHNDKS